MTLNQIVYDILEIIRGNQISDDSDIDERQIEFQINTQRALIIREMIKNGGRINEQLIQPLGCLELEEADAADCCEITSDCSLIRTKLEMPRFLEIDGSLSIMSVQPVIKLSKPFSFIPYEQAIYAGEGKYNKDMIFVFLYNKRFYIKSNDPAKLLLNWLSVRPVLENPTEASNFSNCGGTDPCYTHDSEYPIDAWMIPIIKERVIKQLAPSLNVAKDTSNDSKDNIDSNNRN